MPTFKTEETGDVTVISITGLVTLRKGSADLRNAIRAELGKGARKLVLDFEGVLYIDSFSIGEIASGRNETVRLGGEIKLTAPNKQVGDLLVITNNDALFDIHADVDAAVRCFGGEHIGCCRRNA
jgi:anti-anti-sigma factor